MRIIKNKWNLLLINFALTLLFFVIWAPQHNLFQYINVLFFVDYFYLFIGILLYVIRGKFFDGITYSFRRFRGRMSKTKDYLDDWQKKPLPSEQISPSLLGMFMFQGSILLVFMLGLLALFYQIR